MQIILIAVLLIALVAFIIFKVNNKFELKEFVILFAVLILTGIVVSFLVKNKKQEVPEVFKTKYEKTFNTKIDKFSFERLNNKMVSSKTNFIYNFDYIMIKDNKEFVCSTKDVKIKKIQDEFVFYDFENLNEKCIEKK